MTSRIEQLQRLERDYGAYGRLLDAHAGCLWLAGYRLALLRSGHVPTARSVWIACREINERADALEFVPCEQSIRSLCINAHLPLRKS